MSASVHNTPQHDGQNINLDEGLRRPHLRFERLYICRDVLRRPEKETTKQAKALVSIDIRYGLLFFFSLLIDSTHEKLCFSNRQLANGATCTRTHLAHTHTHTHTAAHTTHDREQSRQQAEPPCRVNPPPLARTPRSSRHVQTSCRTIPVHAEQLPARGCAATRQRSGSRTGRGPTEVVQPPPPPRPPQPD